MEKLSLQTAWSEYLAPDASTDRGWFKAIVPAYDPAVTYTSGNIPVWDEDLKAWRETSTLGNYLDYGPCRRDSYTAEKIAEHWPDGMVHAVSYAAITSRYHHTVAEAKAWIETEAQRVRPELAVQLVLALAN